MATQINSLNWSKTLSLDRAKSPPVFNRFLCEENENEKSKLHLTKFITQEARSSLIYSAKLRQSLEESRKAFLNLFTESNTKENATNETKENVVCQEQQQQHHQQQQQRKPPTKKISFKIKKTSSIYKRTPNTAKLTANNVAQLTNKFNNLLNEHKNVVLEKPTIAKLVRKVNNMDNSLKVTRKPSVKIKPTKFDEKTVYVIKKTSLNRKVSVKKIAKREYQSDNNSNKMCVRAKISYLESPKNLTKRTELDFYDTERLIYVPKSPTAGTVRAAIEIFEQRTTKTPEKEIAKDPPKILPKPQVPAKNFSQKQKVILMKNAEKNSKLFCVDKCKENNDLCNEKTETDEVQIINIPLVPPRKCESNYEAIKRITPPKIVVTQEKPVIRIKQTSEANVLIDHKPNNSFLWRKNSLPSISSLQSQYDFNLESNENKLTTNEDFRIVEAKNDFSNFTNWEDLYDTVEATIGQITNVDEESAISDIQKNELPLPPKKIYKRKLSLPKDIDDKTSTTSSNDHEYEYCDYQDLEECKSDDGYEYCSTPQTETVKENLYETLPIPQQQQKTQKPSITIRPLPPRPPSRESYCTIKNDEDNSAYETIYISSTNNKIHDDSNYESIYSCNKQWSIASNRDSIVSSEQQNNSLYGRSIRSWSDEVLPIYSGKATSDLSSSDKSDEWVDISDNEENKKSNSTAFVV